MVSVTATVETMPASVVAAVVAMMMVAVMVVAVMVATAVTSVMVPCGRRRREGQKTERCRDNGDSEYTFHEIVLRGGKAMSETVSSSNDRYNSIRSICCTN